MANNKRTPCSIIKGILDQIEKQKPSFIRSYPIPLYLLAQFRNNHPGYHFNPRHVMTLTDPMYEENGLFFYEVNNAPSLLYRRTSFEISKAFSEWVYKKDIARFWDLFG